MPVYVDNKLKTQAKKKGLSKKKTGTYVYGTMRKMNLLGKT